MAELLRTLYLPKNCKYILIVSSVALLTVLLSIFWPFWLLFGILLYGVSIIYFSKGFRDVLNIHVVALSLIVLLATPSTIMILNREIILDTYESLALYSSITIGLIGYICGALILRGTLSFEKRQNTRLSVRLNALFDLTYRYRYILALICSTILFCWGFLPMGISYTSSVSYRMNTPGVFQYFDSLIPAVFSPLMLAMIIIIGDLKRFKRLTWLSYILIILVLASIIGGHRSWIVSLFACLMLAFQPLIKGRNMLLIVILAAFMFFILSGAVRYVRSGESFVEYTNRFYEYFSNLGNMSFTDLMWGWSDLIDPFMTFITLVRNIPNKIGFDYMLPVKDFSLLIPTLIYPNRPLAPAYWYVQTFEPELFAQGRGLTFYVIGFGYLFAGPIGVFLTLFIFGALFEGLGKFFKLVGSAAGTFLYSYFFFQIFTFANGGGPIVFTKAVIMNYIIPVALLFLFVLILNSFRLKHRGTSK